MADPQTTVALNIGSQRIGMAVFEVSKNGGLVLKAYDSETIVADPAMDSTRVSQTRVAVADLAQRLKVGKAKARYALSGQSVLTRFVKLPPIQGDDIEQIVTFEAQQQLPFPLNEVVWDYEMIEGAASEKEVVIVAIKNDALDEINGAVNDCGLGTAEVDVAPMALYNSFRSTYGAPEEPVLLIDIGAKSSNLLYIEGKRFFTRSVNIGGSSITAAIAKEYNIPFMEAEHQKISNGLVALGGGHTEQMDEAVAALAMVIRNALSRLPAEISRTTNYYRSQHGGSAPRRILLAGGGANLPYTLEFFQEKLNLPVEYFNPVRNVAIGKGVDPAVVQREGHLMGELVGLGLRGSGKSEINIDLVPVVVEQSRAADRRKPFFIAAAAVLLAGMAAWAISKNIAAANASEKEQLMVGTRETLQPIKTRIDGLLKREASLRQIAAAGYAGTEADRAFWMDLIAELRGAFASDSVWLTDLEPINGFSAAKALEPKTAANAKAQNGRPVVKADFFNAQYGASSLADIQVEQPQPQGRAARNAPPPGPPVITANAIRIRGFWRENAKNQNVVYDLLKNLRDNSSVFKFTVQDPAAPAKTINLGEDQNLGKILTISNVPEKAGDLGMPFEITLPLAREVVVK